MQSGTPLLAQIKAFLHKAYNDIFSGQRRMILHDGHVTFYFHSYFFARAKYFRFCLNLLLDGKLRVSAFQYLLMLREF